MAGVRFARNVYWSGLPAGEWFAVAREGQDYLKWINLSARNGWLPFEQTRMDLAQWTRHTGEQGARAERVRYVDPERTIEGYMKHLGLEPSFEAFIREARRQRKGNWRREFTAEAVNAWFRAGFAVAGD
jgi:hypothetical protein